MNKTLTINISGVVFHINEDAFEKLSKYLNTIKGYFKDSEGRDEIMADIEARIAEILQEKTGQTKQVVLMADVDQVIAALGKPEEFAEDSASQQNSGREQEETITSRRRRVFRDPDEKILGGVCSGIANYFDIDPMWLRLGFVVAFLLFGSGFLLYIIMWIVIPVAKTTAEKLEMRGEHINIGNIKKTIDEELGHVKKQVRDLAGEARTVGKNIRNREHSDRFIEFMRTLFTGIFRVIGKIIAVFLVIVCTAILICFVGSFFGLSRTIQINEDNVFISYSFQEFMNAIFYDGSLWYLSLISAFLILGVPVLALLYKSIKVLFNIKTRSGRFLKGIFIGLWITGIIFGFYVAITMASQFSAEASNKQKYNITQPQGDTLYLKVNNNSLFSESESERNEIVSHNWKLVAVTDKSISLGYPRLDIVPSESDSFELVVTRTARGSNRKEAIERSKQIMYHLEQNDSMLIFDPSFELNIKDKWRNQEIYMLLKVPKNKVVFLDRSMKKVVYDIHNVSNTYDEDMVGRMWKMTADGLECIDCEGLDLYISTDKHIHHHINKSIHNEQRRERDRALRDAERALNDAERKLEKLKNLKHEE